MKRLQSLKGKYHAPLPTADIFTPSQLHRVRQSPPLLEIKHRLGKSTQSFSIEHWPTKSSPQSSSSSCVGRWVIPKNSMFGSPDFGYSWGVWFDSGPMKHIGKQNDVQEIDWD
jgi:hypothetical protein